MNMHPKDNAPGPWKKEPDGEALITREEIMSAENLMDMFRLRGVPLADDGFVRMLTIVDDNNYRYQWWNKLTMGDQ